MWFKGNALCFCVFGGGVEAVGVGFRVGDGGESGVVFFHSTWVKAKVLYRCIFGGEVGDVGARQGEVVGGGYSTVRYYASTGKKRLPHWKDRKSTRTTKSMVPPWYALMMMAALFCGMLVGFVFAKAYSINIQDISPKNLFGRP